MELLLYDSAHQAWAVISFPNVFRPKNVMSNISKKKTKASTAPPVPRLRCAETLYALISINEERDEDVRFLKENDL